MLQYCMVHGMGMGYGLQASLSLICMGLCWLTVPIEVGTWEDL